MDTSPKRHSPPSSYLLSLTLSVLVGAGLLTLIGNNRTLQAQTYPLDPREQQISSIQAPANQCVGDGLQLCRCYCRADIRRCENNRISYVSLPLCKAPWVNGNCSSLAYFQTQATDATSCAANDGQPCGGYVRPGDATDSLEGQPIAGALLGCTIVAQPLPPPRF